MQPNVTRFISKQWMLNLTFVHAISLDHLANWLVYCRRKGKIEEPSGRTLNATFQRFMLWNLFIQITETILRIIRAAYIFDLMGREGKKNERLISQMSNFSEWIAENYKMIQGCQHQPDARSLILFPTAQRKNLWQEQDSCTSNNNQFQINYCTENLLK